MKIPESLPNGLHLHATGAEIERLNWLEKRVATLNKWIKERNDLALERSETVARIKARVPQPGGPSN